MMPYALADIISEEPLDGGIEISRAQFDAAFSAKTSGRETIVLEGVLVVRDVAPSPSHTWANGEWVPPPDPEPPTLEDMIAAKLADLDDYRWQIEVGGAAFGGGIIRTDWNSQNKIAAAYIMAINDPEYEIPVWEVVPGVFSALDNGAILALGIAVRDHVQATFNRKAELHAVIAGLPTVAAVTAFDIAANW